jgi:hypothetical protein
MGLLDLFRRRKGMAAHGNVLPEYNGERVEFMTDDATQIVREDPGTAMWTLVRTVNAERVVLLATLARNEMKTIPPQPVSSHRASAIRVQVGGKTVVCIPWLAKVEGNRDWCFESWINIHSTEDIDPMPHLVMQRDLQLVLVETSEAPTLVLSVPNIIDWIKLHKEASSVHPWSMSDYNEAKRVLWGRFSSPQALWAALA